MIRYQEYNTLVGESDEENNLVKAICFEHGKWDKHLFTNIMSVVQFRKTIQRPKGYYNELQPEWFCLTKDKTFFHAIAYSQTIHENLRQNNLFLYQPIDEATVKSITNVETKEKINKLILKSMLL